MKLKYKIYFVAHIHTHKRKPITTEIKFCLPYDWDIGAHLPTTTPLTHAQFYRRRRMGREIFYNGVCPADSLFFRHRSPPPVTKSTSTETGRDRKNQRAQDCLLITHKQSFRHKQFSTLMLPLYHTPSSAQSGWLIAVTQMLTCSFVSESPARWKKTLTTGPPAHVPQSQHSLSWSTGRGRYFTVNKERIYIYTHTYIYTHIYTYIFSSRFIINLN